MDKDYIRSKPNTLSILLDKYPNESWDWNLIVANPNFTKDMFKKYIDYTYKYIARVYNIDLELIEFWKEYMKKNNHEYKVDDFMWNKNIDDNILEKYGEEKLSISTWEFISSNSSLKTLLKYTQNLNWFKVSQSYKFDLATIKRFQNYIEWALLSSNKNITEDIIDEYKDRLNWKCLSLSCNFTEKMLEKYKDYIDWFDLSFNECITKHIIERYIDKWDWSILSYNKSIDGDLIDRYNNRLDWGKLVISSKYININYETIDKYIDKWDWNNLSYSLYIDNIEIIERYKNYWNWNMLSLNRTLPLYIIEKYTHKLEIKYISFNPNITSSFVERYKDSINWANISNNKFIYDNYRYENEYKMDMIRRPKLIENLPYIDDIKYHIIQYYV